MTYERIAEIKALCAAATPGPWKVRESEWECGCAMPSALMQECPKDKRTCGEGQCLEPAWVEAILNLYNGDYDGMNDADARFVAEARQIIPELLEEIEQLNTLDKIRVKDRTEHDKIPMPEIAE